MGLLESVSWLIWIPCCEERTINMELVVDPRECHYASGINSRLSTGHTYQYQLGIRNMFNLIEEQILSFP